MSTQIPTDIAVEGPFGSDCASGEACHAVRRVGVVNDRITDRPAKLHRQIDFLTTGICDQEIYSEVVLCGIVRRIFERKIESVEQALYFDAHVIGAGLLSDRGLRRLRHVSRIGSVSRDGAGIEQRRRNGYER